MALHRKRILVIILAILLPVFTTLESAQGANGPAPTFTFAAAGDFAGLSKSFDLGNASLAYLSQVGADFFLGLGDYSHNASQTGDVWCSQFKHVFNNMEITSGDRDTGGHNSTVFVETHSYERYVSGCPLSLNSPAPVICGIVPTGLPCYGREYYFDYPASNPIARFIMLSPKSYNITGVCTKALETNWPACSSQTGQPCTDTFGCWSYTTNDAHYNWTRNAIDSARQSGIQWIIAGMHKDCISAGENTCSIGSDLFNLMVGKKVDLIIQAHDHAYERSKQLVINQGACPSKFVSANGGYTVYNSTYANCIVNDGSSGTYTGGAGTVVVIAGTFGVGLSLVNSTRPATVFNAEESPYFSTMLGNNTGCPGIPCNEHGFVKYSISPNEIDIQTYLLGGSYQDSFKIVHNTPDFSIAPSPSSLAIFAGSSGTAVENLASLNGFSGTVGLTVSAPLALSASIAPTSVVLSSGGSGSATLTVQVPSSTPTGTYNVNVTGQSGLLSHVTRLTVSVSPPPPDFTLSANPTSLTLNAGQNPTSTITVTSTNGFVGTVFLSASVSPPGWGAAVKLDSTSINLNSGQMQHTNLHFNTNGNTLPGNYQVTVATTSGALHHVVYLTALVTSTNSNFNISASPPSIVVGPNTSLSSNIVLASVNGFQGSVTLVVSFSDNSLTGSCNPLTLAISKGGLANSNCSLQSNALGNYSMTVTGVSGGLTHYTVLTVNVTSFSLVSVVVGTDSSVYWSGFQGGWSSWQPLSGSSPSAPALCSSPGGRLDVVVRGADNFVYHRTLFSNGTSSKSWDSPVGLTNDQPACAVTGGVLYLAVRGVDNFTYLNALPFSSGVWKGWTNLGKATGSSPVLVASSANRLDLLIRGLDNSIQHMSISVGTSMIFSKWDSPGGSTDRAVAAASDGTVIHLVVRGTNGGIYYDNLTVSTGSWGGWMALNGATSSTPALVIDSSGSLQLVVTGMDNVIYHKTKPKGQTWATTWDSPGGSSPSSPAVSANAATLITVVKGLDNFVYYDILGPSGWSGWKGMAGSTAQPPILATVS